MTNEEAIQYNKNLREYMKITDKKSEYKFSEENYIALDMGNKALEIVNDFESAQIITGGRLNGRTYAYKCGLADGQRLAKGEKIFIILPLEQQPCEDCISREEALKVMCDNCPMYNCVCGCSSYRHIERMESVTPKPKIGKWIILDECANEGVYCSECHKKVFKLEFIHTMKWRNFKYCPNCGAKMEVEE